MPSFFIDCNPPKSTSQQKGVMVMGGKPRHFKKKAVREAERDLLSLLAPHRVLSPMEGPLVLSVLWVYPWRSAEPKKNRAAGFLPSDKRPDTDNLIKMLKDCLGRHLFWIDDSQVSFEQMVKGWGDRPGIGVSISPISEDLSLSRLGSVALSSMTILATVSIGGDS